MAEAKLKMLVENTAAAFGATAQVDYQRGYPVMVNSEEQTAFAAGVAAKVTGKETMEVPPIMGGEDFAYMLEARPGAYILVGNGDTAAVHHPEYNFDDDAIPAGCSWWDDAIPAGCSWWAEIIESRMPAS